MQFFNHTHCWLWLYIHDAVNRVNKIFEAIFTNFTHSGTQIAETKQKERESKTRVENLCVYKMTHMMQSMRWLLLECYKFNALLILLTLISHDRFSMVFGITVNPLETLVASSYGSDEYADTGDASNDFDSDIRDLNNIDISQFAFTKYVDSSETVSIYQRKHCFYEKTKAIRFRSARLERLFR